MSLKTNRVATHFFNSAGEVCPASGEPSEFFDVQLTDNLTFDASHVRYKLVTPSSLPRTLDYFMSTKKPTGVLCEDHISNFRGDNLMCEKVEFTMRDGEQVPVVMVYDKRFYTEESPWVLFTRGMDSTKDDLALEATRISLTDRGIVCAFPLIRGKPRLLLLWCSLVAPQSSSHEYLLFVL